MLCGGRSASFGRRGVSLEMDWTGGQGEGRRGVVQSGMVLRKGMELWCAAYPKTFRVDVWCLGMLKHDDHCYYRECKVRLWRARFHFVDIEAARRGVRPASKWRPQELI